MRTVSEVARMFDVDRDVVKTWCYHFAEHLSPEATPPKGQERHFTDSDVLVLAVIFYYWEDDPDFEHIHACLNSGEQDEDILPTRQGTEIRRRCVTQPTDHQAILLTHLKSNLPTLPLTDGL